MSGLLSLATKKIQPVPAEFTESQMLSIRLSGAEKEHFFEMIKNPPKANEKVRAAIQKFLSKMSV